MRWVLRSGLLIAMLGMAVSVGWAQAPKAKKPAGPSVSARVAEQNKQIEAQQATIETQRALLDTLSAVADSQTVRIATQQAQLSALEAQLVQMKNRLEALESQANFPAWEDSLEKRLRQVEAAAHKSPELPPDIVSAGDFPGSIRIPGTDAAIKFGGRIRTSMVLTLDPLGTDDRFLTNSIPVGQPVTGEAKRTSISARASRLNIEFRTPGGAGGAARVLRGRFCGRGQHLSDATRVCAIPRLHGRADLVDVLRPLGRAGGPGLRGCQLGERHPPAADSLLVVAQAQHPTRGCGGDPFRVDHRRPRGQFVPRCHCARLLGAPSMVATSSWRAWLRQIRGQTETGLVRSEWGGGGSLTGVATVPFRGLTDRFLFQVNGGYGIARYINDLNSAGGLDAVFDTTSQELKPVPAIGWYLAYEHRWKEWEMVETMNLRSTVLWSVVVVDNLDIQPPDAYRRTHRFAANVVFSPAPRADLGLEYLFGTRTNKDGQNGRANQFQLVALLRF